MIAGFLRELRYSARSLSRTPALATALIVTIALGIASNASVDGFMRGLLAQEQPFPTDAMASISRLLRTAAMAVFVIACANVAAFLLARAAARSRETAVRVAIGAGRRQLLQQAVADSLLISLLGAITGVVLAYWIARIVPALLFDQDAEHMQWQSDAGGVAWVAIGCAAVTLLCGLLPMIETRHDDPGAIMQRENQGPSVASMRIGAGLVVFQMAACTLLVIAAGLLLAGYRSSLQTSTGRRLSNATVASVEATQTSSKSLEAVNGATYFEQSERVARDVTGATTIGWVAILQGDRPTTRSFTFERAGLPLKSVTLQRKLFTRDTGAEITLPPVAGRLFRSADTGACGGIVLTEAAARELGPASPVGRSLETPGGWSEIIGVVRATDAEKPVVYHYAPDAEAAPAESAVYRYPQTVDEARSELLVNIVSRNYFSMMGLRVTAGRDFTDRLNACRVAIVNEEAAERYFGGAAIGGAIIDANGLRTSVIGVVSSAKLRVSSRDVEPTIYLPMDQDFQPRMTMVMETESAGGSMMRELHKRLALIPGGRNERIIVDSLEHHLSRTAFAPERVTLVLVGSSAAISLALGLLGLYGVMADATRRRRREFALRIALGAQRRHVIRQVMLEGTRLVVAGTLAGLAGSFIVAQWMTQIAPATEGASPMVWIAAPLMLALSIGIASIFPARKALASDPLLIMRSE